MEFQPFTPTTNYSAPAQTTQAQQSTTLLKPVSEFKLSANSTGCWSPDKVTFETN